MHYKQLLKELITPINAFLRLNLGIQNLNLVADTKDGLILIKQDGKFVARAKMAISS